MTVKVAGSQRGKMPHRKRSQHEVRDVAACAAETRYGDVEMGSVAAGLEATAVVKEKALIQGYCLVRLGNQIQAPPVYSAWAPEL
jgi:hypothetical protein